MTETVNTEHHLVSQIGKNDYRSAVYFNLYGKKKTVLPVLLIGVFIAALRIFGRVLGFMPANDLLFFACVAYLCIIIVMLVISEWQIGKFATLDRIMSGQEQKLLLDENGVSDESDGVGEPILFPWDTILEAYELRDLFILYVTQQRAILIPKPPLPQEERRYLKETFEEKLKGRFVQKSK